MKAIIARQFINTAQQDLTLVHKFSILIDHQLLSIQLHITIGKVINYNYQLHFQHPCNKLM